MTKNWTKIFNSMTVAQREAACRIGFGEDQVGTADVTLKFLEKKGILESSQSILPGRLPVRITKYYMPIHVHINFCEWLAEQPEDLDELKG